MGEESMRKDQRTKKNSSDAIGRENRCVRCGTNELSDVSLLPTVEIVCRFCADEFETGHLSNGDREDERLVSPRDIDGFTDQYGEQES
jgi:hypothetical protein